MTTLASARPSRVPSDGSPASDDASGEPGPGDVDAPMGGPATGTEARPTTIPAPNTSATTSARAPNRPRRPRGRSGARLPSDAYGRTGAVGTGSNGLGCHRDGGAGVVGGDSWG